MMMINPAFGPPRHHTVWRRFGLMQCGWDWCTWDFLWGKRERTSLYQLLEEQELLLRQIPWVGLEMLSTRIKVSWLSHLQATKIWPFLLSPATSTQLLWNYRDVQGSQWSYFMSFLCSSIYIHVYMWERDRMKTYRYSQTGKPPVRSHTLPGTHVNHPQNESTENQTSLVLLLRELLIFPLNF